MLQLEFLAAFQYRTMENDDGDSLIEVATGVSCKTVLNEGVQEMLKKMIVGVGLSVIVATLLYAQTPQRGGAAGRGAQAAGPARAPKLPTVEQWNNMPASAKAYVDKARAIAGDDNDLKFDFSNVCSADGGSNRRKTYGIPDNEPFLQPYPGPDPAVPMKPYKYFDNLWWFGTSDVGSYLLVTNDGYILFDALNNAHEARDIIVGGMKKVGLDPAKIKYFIIGHNHLDHTGGAHYIQSNFHPKTIMGRDDWKIYFDTVARAKKDRDAGTATGQGAGLDDLEVMTHDIDAEDSMKVTLGGTTVTLYFFPGHTPGSLAAIFPVKYKGTNHPILLVPAANDIDNRSSFIAAYERVWQMAINAKVESVLHVHPNISMNSLARMKYDDEHPDKTPLILYGAEKTRKYLEIERACTQARMEILGW